MRLRTIIVITVLFVAFLTGVVIIADSQPKLVPESQNDEQDKMAAIQNDLQGISDKYDNIISLLKNVDFTEVERLTEDKIMLEQENADLKAQLEAAGSFWKGGER